MLTNFTLLSLVGIIPLKTGGDVIKFGIYFHSIGLKCLLACVSLFYLFVEIQYMVFCKSSMTFNVALCIHTRIYLCMYVDVLFQLVAVPKLYTLTYMTCWGPCLLLLQQTLLCC